MSCAWSVDIYGKFVQAVNEQHRETKHKNLRRIQLLAVIA